MKNIKSLVLMLLVLLSACFLFSCASQPEEPEEEPIVTSKPKEYWDDVVGAEEDFLADRLWVVLFAEYSENRDYTPDDFPGIGCIAVSTFICNDGHADLTVYLDKDDRENAIRIVKELEKRPDIQYVAPSYGVINIGAVPATGVYNLDYQGFMSRFGLWEAWNISTGSSDVRVGVIDTGIDGTHPDFAGRINASLSESYTNYNSQPLVDMNGHGTHVAGIIGANGTNSIGVAGVCWEVELVSLNVHAGGRALDNQGICEAIKEADSKGIDILNLSMDCEYPESLSEAREIADSFKNIRNALAEFSGLFVYSAGNYDFDLDQVFASYSTTSDPVSVRLNDLDNVICVGSVNQTFIIASDSNYGKTSVDLMAPGVDIISCYPTSICELGQCDPDYHVQNGYHEGNGTSMACPQVAGVAALLLSLNPNLSNEDIKNVIFASVEKLTALNDKCVYGGRLHPGDALTLYSTHQHTSAVYEYEQTGSFSQHKCKCIYCDYETMGAHDWQLTYVGASVPGDNEIASTPITENELLAGGDEAEPQYRPQYVCNICGMKSPTNPNLMQ